MYKFADECLKSSDLKQNRYLNFKMYEQRSEITCTMRKVLGLLFLERRLGSTSSWFSSTLKADTKLMESSWRRQGVICTSFSKERFRLNTRNNIFAVRTHPLEQPLQGHGWVLIAGSFQAADEQIISFTFLFPWGWTRWLFEVIVNPRLFYGISETEKRS